MPETIRPRGTIDPAQPAQPALPAQPAQPAQWQNLQNIGYGTDRQRFGSPARPLALPAMPPLPAGNVELARRQGIPAGAQEYPAYEQAQRQQAAQVEAQRIAQQQQAQQQRAEQLQRMAFEQGQVPAQGRQVGVLGDSPAGGALGAVGAVPPMPRSQTWQGQGQRPGGALIRERGQAPGRAIPQDQQQRHGLDTLVARLQEMLQGSQNPQGDLMMILNALMKSGQL